MINRKAAIIVAGMNRETAFITQWCCSYMYIRCKQELYTTKEWHAQCVLPGLVWILAAGAPWRWARVHVQRPSEDFVLYCFCSKSREWHFQSVLSYKPHQLPLNTVLLNCIGCSTPAAKQKLLQDACISTDRQTTFCTYGIWHFDIGDIFATLPGSDTWENSTYIYPKITRQVVTLHVSPRRSGHHSLDLWRFPINYNLQ